MGESLRLLQAGDVNLDVPLYGVAHRSGDLSGHLANARYTSFQALVDSAIQRQVDAVVLAGNLLPVQRPGSRALWFLHQQFSRLAEHNVTLLIRGEALPQAPAGLSWPTNIIPTTSRHAVSWMTRSQQTVRVSDGLHPVDLSGVADHQLVIGGDLPSRHRLEDSPGTFWACSGELGQGPAIAGLDRAHLCGPLQGGSFDEPGPQGAWELTLQRGQCRDLRPVHCDTIQWHQEELLLESGSTRQGVLEEMSSRSRQLQHRAGTTVVVRWTLAGEGELLESLWAPKAQQEMLRDLRHATPDCCGSAELLVVATDEQRNEQAAVPIVAAARQLLTSVTQRDSLDLQLVGGFDSDEVPGDCRMLTQQRFHTFLSQGIDQRLWGDLLVRAKSA